MAKKKVIIFIDGGLCSQMLFFALGMFFEHHGYDVKYDLSWFRKYGKDNDNRFDRSFAMDRAFPTLKYNVASRFMVWIYRHLFKKKWSIDNLPRHLYVCGYFELRGESFIKYKDVFIKHFNPVDLYLVQDLLDEIQNTESCAVHVRRGDLAKYDPVYGMPPSAEQFVRAINYVLTQKPKSVFYFFSDETDFVKESIIPLLNKKIKYKICDKNGSDKGYLDFYLIAHAKSVIASQGSFGRKAKELNTTPGLLFVSTYDF